MNVRKIPSDRFSRREELIPYTGPASSLDGIIDFLREKHDGDPHEKGIIELTASVPERPPKERTSKVIRIRGFVQKSISLHNQRPR